jgi:hypothetical protein
MANPRFLRWHHDGRNTDGSLFTPEQFAGFELSISRNEVAGVVSVPTSFSLDGGYELPLADLVAVDGISGEFTVRIRVVNRAGNPSEWSAPLTFSQDFRVPTAPFGLSVGSF